MSAPPHSILFDTGVIRRVYERRLRDLMFSPEDAMVLAYGSFGIDVSVSQVGVDTLVTNDLRLARHFQVPQAEVARRFSEMRAQLPEPYPTLTLPDVMTTTSILVQ